MKRIVCRAGLLSALLMALSFGAPMAHAQLPFEVPDIFAPADAEASAPETQPSNAPSVPAAPAPVSPAPAPAYQAPVPLSS